MALIQINAVATAHENSSAMSIISRFLFQPCFAWTFDEAAQVAEHLKRDLKIDKVLFSMAGGASARW